MLAITDAENKFVTDFMRMRAPNEEVMLIQKVHRENVHGTEHEIYDVHTDEGRWWVISNPTNMYSQEQFPNMDIALTFHLGLMFRVLRSENERDDTAEVSPFEGCFRQMQDAADALAQSMELGDFQAIGVRCRETLLAFAGATRKVFPWKSEGEPPKKGDFKAWVDHTCAVMLSGETHENRRHLFKALLEASWKFNNWLTHAKGATSMGSVGDCFDNAMMESFFSSLEAEVLDRYRLRTREEARAEIFSWIEGWYNTHRRHSALGYVSPREFERRFARKARVGTRHADALLPHSRETARR